MNGKENNYGQQLVNTRGLLSLVKDVATLLQLLIVPVFLFVWSQNTQITDLQREVAVLKTQVTAYASLGRTKAEAAADLMMTERRLSVMEERLDSQRQRIQEIEARDKEMKIELEQHRNKSTYDKAR